MDFTIKIVKLTKRILEQMPVVQNNPEVRAIIAQRVCVKGWVSERALDTGSDFLVLEMANGSYGKFFCSAEVRRMFTQIYV